MKGTCQLIGFIGSEKYEIITYLSCILYQLSKRVLIVDFSETQALRYGLPQEESYFHVKSEDALIIDYRGVDYYCTALPRKEIQVITFLNKLEDYCSKYDAILIDFGFCKNHLVLRNCDQLYYVTDLQKYNVNRLLASLRLGLEQSVLLIKDVQSCKITPSYITREVSSITSIRKTYVMYQDIVDTKYKISSQYNQAITFSKISKELIEVLLDIIAVTYPEIELKILKRAFRKAKRGCKV